MSAIDLPAVTLPGLAMLVLLAACAENQPETGCRSSIDLPSYRWKNRLLIVCADKPETLRMAEYRAAWAGREAGVAERDMVVFHLYASGPGQVAGEALCPEAAAGLRRELKVPPEGFQMLLIGKDGGVKLRSGKPVPPAEVFSLIDGMPMRREEMRRRGVTGG